DDVEDVPPGEHCQVRVVGGGVHEALHVRAGEPGQRVLALVAGTELVDGGAEAEGVVLRVVHDVAVLDQDREQVVGRAARQAELAGEVGRRYRLGPAGQVGQGAQGVPGGGGIGHGTPLRASRLVAELLAPQHDRKS